MNLPVLSLWQPWASLWVHGRKRIETRSWACPLDLPCVLAVHAAKRWDAEAALLSRTGHFRTALDAIAPEAIWNARVCPLPTGAVVGLVRLVSCRKTGAWAAELTAQERAFGDYRAERYGWIADRFEVLPRPMPLRGLQSVFLWSPPTEVLEMAARLLGE